MRENELSRYDDFIISSNTLAAVPNTASHKARGRDRGKVCAASIFTIGIIASIALSYAICSGTLMHLWNG